VVAVAWWWRWCGSGGGGGVVTRDGGGGSGISRVEEKKGFPRIYLVIMPALRFSRASTL